MIDLTEDRTRKEVIPHLDIFTRNYVVALLWVERLDGSSVHDLSRPALRRAITECREFQEQNAELLERAYGNRYFGNAHVYGPAAAGHDFALTRQGAGAGFWDGDIPKEEGNALTEATDDFKTLYVHTSGGYVFTE